MTDELERLRAENTRLKAAIEAMRGGLFDLIGHTSQAQAIARDAILKGKREELGEEIYKR